MRPGPDLRCPCLGGTSEDRSLHAIAQGCGRPSGAAQRHFFDIARGSAAEVGAIIDLLGADADKRRDALRVVQMVSKLR